MPTRTDSYEGTFVTGKNIESCKECVACSQSIFSSLDGSDIGSFNQIRRQFNYTAGQGIPLEVDQRSGFFCIKSGHVKLSVKQGLELRAVRICGPGDTIGYGSWLSDHAQPAEALDAVTVCFFDKELFLLAQEKAPDLNTEIIKMLCREVSIRDDKIASLEKGTVKQKVASTLLSLNKKFGTASITGSKISVRLDRKTLAEFSGTVVETLARVLTEFENEGIVLRRARSIYILDPKRLSDCTVG